MSERTLIIALARNGGYRDLCLADATARGESPIALKLGDAAARRAVDRWLDVADRLAVYDDFGVGDDVQEIAQEADALGVEVEWRSLGKRPKPTIRELIAGLVG